MLPTREAILQYHETLPDNIKRTTAGKFYKAFASNPQKWMTYLYDAKEWFGEMYNPGEDQSADPVVLEAASWDYHGAVSMFATLKNLQLHTQIKDESSLYRLHDLALDTSRFQPRVGDVVRVSPHKSCISFSSNYIDKVVGRDTGSFDVVLECAFPASQILWNYACAILLSREEHAYTAFCANDRKMEFLLGRGDGSKYVDVVDLDKVSAKTSAVFGLPVEKVMLVAVMSLLTKLSEQPIRQELEVIVHTGMKPFEARISSIVEAEAEED